MQSFDTTTKVLLLSHPRSGSHTVMKFLNLHPSLFLINEPFHNQREELGKNYINYKKSVRDISSLDIALDNIHRICNGFKHHFRQLPDELNLHLFQKNYKIIFLHRKNQLKSIVSWAMAQQNEIWTIEQKSEAIKSGKIKDGFNPLDIDEIERIVNLQQQRINLYREYLKKSESTFFEVYFEDLLENKNELRNAIFTFLNVPKLVDGTSPVVNQIFSQITQVNDLSSYQKIPNIAEIETRLGSDISGHVFESNL